MVLILWYVKGKKLQQLRISPLLQGRGWSMLCWMLDNCVNQEASGPWYCVYSDCMYHVRKNVHECQGDEWLVIVNITYQLHPAMSGQIPG